MDTAGSEFWPKIAHGKAIASKTRALRTFKTPGYERELLKIVERDAFLNWGWFF
jgi:hypothetical protein